jgi:hypothetical protein
MKHPGPVSQPKPGRVLSGRGHCLLPAAPHESTHSTYESQRHLRLTQLVRPNPRTISPRVDHHARRDGVIAQGMNPVVFRARGHEALEHAGPPVRKASIARPCIWSGRVPPSTTEPRSFEACLIRSYAAAGADRWRDGDIGPVVKVPLHSDPSGLRSASFLLDQSCRCAYSADLDAFPSMNA